MKKVGRGQGGSHVSWSEFLDIIISAPWLFISAYIFARVSRPGTLHSKYLARHVKLLLNATWKHLAIIFYGTARAGILLEPGDRWAPFRFRLYWLYVLFESITFKWIKLYRSKHSVVHASWSAYFNSFCIDIDNFNETLYDHFCSTLVKWLCSPPWELLVLPIIDYVDNIVYLKSLSTISWFIKIPICLHICSHMLFGIVIFCTLYETR